MPSAIVPKSLSLIALTELVGGEVLRPEGLAIGQLHLVLQPKAVALRDGGGQGGEGGRGEGCGWKREPGETQSSSPDFISRRIFWVNCGGFINS